MKTPTGSFVTLNGQSYYKISNTEAMKPFSINMVSSSNIWLFMSSKGGVTAGRKNSSGAIFPYETEDKLHSAAYTGSKTIVRVNGNLWEPFERTHIRKYNITQNIYKGIAGNSVMHEEINHDLKLCFRYRYECSEEFGIVKTSELECLSDGDTVQVELLDGLQNLMPYGVNEVLQASTSTLVDAYKASEHLNNGLAVYSLTTFINDTPSPEEMLRANVAWNTKGVTKIALTSDVVEAFCLGDSYSYGCAAYGKKGAYFLSYEVTLKSKEATSHSIVIDCGYTHSQLAQLSQYLKDGDFSKVYENIKDDTTTLMSLVAMADGIQTGGDLVACNHHYLNTLYNVMRGGIFAEGYALNYEDFKSFVAVRNKSLAEDDLAFEKIKGCKDIHELKKLTAASPDLYRLALEYLPISFSRRHGDPSRPWNKFNINVRDENGKRIYNYEGNWRDIFQNWEGLCLSFPCYFENVVAKFVNASTVDGFNPYRINRNGIDWEKPEPENPFGGYGYWGDHQIIYLLRLLQGLNNHFPNILTNMLDAEIFSYANVPYVLSSYDEILKNSKDTITFDFSRDAEIEQLCEKIGTDGRLVQKDGRVYMVTLSEKLIVTMLSKISNLLCGGGIWMNTQRPEWNDANNAIVGIGLSMVTVYHLHAYITFLEKLFKDKDGSFVISKEVCDWLLGALSAIKGFNGKFQGNEKSLLDSLGRLFSNYRENAYKNGFSAKTTVDYSEVKELLDLCSAMTLHTINLNKGDIYETYNLLKEDFTSVPMRPMLEGQSAVIGCGLLEANEVCSLIENMKPSLYDESLRTYLLYPKKLTSPFAEKNSFTAEIKADGKIIVGDVNNALHFAPSITTRQQLEQALVRSSYSKDECSKLVEIFEATFNHNTFTGRSQVMYKFEGIGCVYWHQNAKFALAVLETAIRTHMESKDVAKVYDAYREVTKGFIYRKTPKECSAIPIEPYSHTSFNGTSEQPGMTGQVKESVIMRRGELGVVVNDGCLSFLPYFVAGEEFDENGEICFSVCGTSVKYIKNNGMGMKITFADNTVLTCAEEKLPAEISKAIFVRDGSVLSVEIQC